jgi:HSP20 family molecular chaperone IbpA
LKLSRPFCPGEETYNISLAVAGFSPDDLTAAAQQNLLTISGRKSETSNHQYLYQAFRRSERRFSLEDHVEVASAGLLRIELVRRGTITTFEIQQLLSIGPKTTDCRRLIVVSFS